MTYANIHSRCGSSTVKGARFEPPQEAYCSSVTHQVLDVSVVVGSAMPDGGASLTRFLIIMTYGWGWWLAEIGVAMPNGFDPYPALSDEILA